MRLFVCEIILFSLISLSFQNDLNEFDLLARNYEEQGKIVQAADFYNKAGYAYWNKNNYVRAAYTFEKAYEYYDNANNIIACITIGNNLGLIYSETGNFSKAQTAFTNVLNYARRARNTQEIYNALINLTNVLIDLQSYSLAINYAKEALNIATEMNNLKNIAKCYSLLAEGYEKIGDAKSAYKYYDLFAVTDKKIKEKEIELIKNMSAEEISKANEQKRVTEIELKIKKGELKSTQDSLFVMERIALQRQIEINKRNAELQQKELQLKYERKIRKILVSGIVIILVFLIILSILSYHLKIQKTEITLQRNQLNIQNKNITDSILYGLRIQKAMLPPISTLNQYFETFVIYKPKDIVSGDFYWHRIIKYNTLTYHFIAVVDCTGHGVPGAFMSMIGNRLLNEIVETKKIIQPSEILTYLNEYLEKELNQNESQTNDGMDIALCRIASVNNNEYEVVFSGAKRPLFYFKNDDRKINIIEGNLISIGNIKRHNTKNFVEQHLKLESNDTIILFTDGIIDQPNAERKKFGTNQFIEILNENIPKGLNYCQKSLDLAFENHKNDIEQRDDLTILAIKLK